jgi:hypothetical protein
MGENVVVALQWSTLFRGGSWEPHLYKVTSSLFTVYTPICTYISIIFVYIEPLCTYLYAVEEKRVSHLRLVYVYVKSANFIL